MAAYNFHESDLLRIHPTYHFIQDRRTQPRQALPRLTVTQRRLSAASTWASPCHSRRKCSERWVFSPQLVTGHIGSAAPLLPIPLQKSENISINFISLFHSPPVSSCRLNVGAAYCYKIGVTALILRRKMVHGNGRSAVTSLLGLRLLSGSATWRSPQAEGLELPGHNCPLGLAVPDGTDLAHRHILLGFTSKSKLTFFFYKPATFLLNAKP